MRTLDEARAVCETYLPGLYADLSNTPLLELEAPGNPGLEMFRKYGGPALLIPEKYAAGRFTVGGGSSRKGDRFVRAVFCPSRRPCITSRWRASARWRTACAPAVWNGRRSKQSPASSCCFVRLRRGQPGPGHSVTHRHRGPHRRRDRDQRLEEALQHVQINGSALGKRRDTDSRRRYRSGVGAGARGNAGYRSIRSGPRTCSPGRRATKCV